MDCEHGQVIPRCLDHGCELKRQLGAAVAARALFGAEQSPQSGHVQPGPGPIDDAVEHFLHLSAHFEYQVAAVLGLVDRVLVAEAAAVLLGQVQPEAQAGRIDPLVADLAAAPYRRGLRQGVCDLSQACGVGDCGEAVALFSIADPRLSGLGGDVLVAVEDDLRGERRMPGHLDRHMAPLRVHDVEGIVIDKGHLLCQIDDHPTPGASDLPHRRRGPRHQDEEHPRSHRVAGQVLLGELMLTLTTLAVDDRDLVGSGPGPHPTSEPTGHPHQMRIVQLLITTLMPPPPPHPKPARLMTQREVRVEHNAIHAVIAARQQIPLTFGELINHRDTL